MLSDLFSADSLIDITEVLESEKSVKTTHEVAGVSRASRIACIGLAEFQRRVDAGPAACDWSRRWSL
jgi:Xaa-Pro aminopeptidase